MVANGTVAKEDPKHDKIPAATLDEAMTLAGLGIYNILHMLLCGVILLGVIMQSLALGYVMPAAQCDLQLTLQQRGWLAAIPFLAIILMSYFWGWLADTRGRRPVMLFSMLANVVFSVLTSFAPDLISFAILQFFSSVFMSGPSAVVYTFIGEFNCNQHRDKMVAFGSSFVGIGTVVLPAICWLILPLEFSFYIPFLDIFYRPWRLLVVACAVPYMISSVLLLFTPESPKFLSATGQKDKVLNVVKNIYSVNRRQHKKSFPVESIIVETQTEKDPKNKGIKAIFSSMREQTVPLFKPPLLPWTCLTCFVQFGIFATTNGFYVWFPTILNAVVNHDGGPMRICDILSSSSDVNSNNSTDIECNDTMNTATFQNSIYIGLVFSSMYLIVGFLVDFVGKKLILVVLLFSTGVCGICAQFAYNKQLAVVLFAVFQMSGACIGLMTAVAVEMFPTKFRAMALCLSMMMGRVGSMMGSNLIGVFLQTNCGVSFYLFGGIIILNSLFCLTLPKKKKDKTPTKEIAAEATQNETHEPV
ncbi:synaptic vesicle glycoprotein 2C-like [Galleria mellonella]|uniref:Synaptic vesicle glycoprotein 2C-like n=1 Tax=Galleria mellonella TaxID=7137 RepID=A0A6J1WUJ3_GALME|nr:synaptic vesicle glycoprotein 2C-like [Galleria mellonella]XP_026759666.2 synaptic vesicle glycoprotein 2C-like [Galleria mellonella]XP_052758157.1 synaptic vesicle glycoprotein 2C-like [Galleria mellonella]